jgi:LppX/LprAFG-like lipoprotein
MRPTQRLCLTFLSASLLLAAACQSGLVGSSAKATPTPTPRERLDAAAKKMQAVNAFHFLLTHQNGVSTIANGLEMSRAEGDFQAPDRFKAAVKASFQTFPVSVSVINAGNQTWITNPLQAGEHYQPLPNGPQTTEILDPNHGLLKAAEDMRDPKLTGTENIGSVETLLIAGNVDAGGLRAIATDAEAGRLVPAQIWLGKNDSLVYRVRLNGPLSASEPKNIVRQIDLSQFNEKIDIAPPST